MLDIGVSCQKHSYGRTAGVPLTCKPDEEYDAGLCYTPCRDGYDGVGPVCWEICPAGKYECGALCVDTPDGCTDSVQAIAEAVVAAAVAIAAAVVGVIDIMAIVTALGDVALSLAYGVCQPPSIEELLTKTLIN
mmetsp:Transcript_12920/g.9353  ORF Transcript_12920/g.9353 Transcript_12920/m.9353 type:complete len:134 (+) Transcript_12920:434-835(+)